MHLSFPLTIYLLALIYPALALYDSSDDVIELDSTSFQRVTSSDDVWLVEFYAPWCGHCNNLVPEWKRAATALKGVVKVAAVDATQHSDLAQRFEIKGFPTILIFGKNKQTPTRYQGARSAESITSEAMRQLSSVVSARLSGRGADQGSGESDVIELTDSNFEEKVLQSDDSWLVEFFAPWCGHCKSLQPHWEEAARDLKGRVKVGALDATVHSRMAERYGVQGYPTIKFFPAGVKTEPMDYEGPRIAADIVRWATEQTEASLPPPDVVQITSNDVAKEACGEHAICVIGVLPPLLDCQSDCRNDYLATIRSEAEKFKKQKWGWTWTEALQQPALEKALDIGGFGYPAMAAVHIRKMKYTTMRGPFNTAGVHSFLLDLSLGGSGLPLFDLKAIPDMVDVQPWDGNDAKMEEEEEIDLSELGIKTEL